ncbi:hypothetical protein GLOIN_2v1542684 [Rhizophagus irregularis DAOM 181602=DAOM 197198]|nr:hypothetical protein GLOIN_2v1542684 [Rhizophagus irregularis DAOM 181602=DAOM 197198]
METYENQIKYNDDGSVNVPFGRAAEWYISNANLLKNYRLKNQSRQVTPKLVKAGILTVELLTSLGRDLVSQIELGLAKNQQCWYWVMYCSGDGGNCQRLCGSVGKYSIVLSRRADHRTAKGIKVKLLTSLNGASEEVINNALASQRIICNNDKLRQFVARDDKKLKDDTGPWTQLDSLVNNILKSQGFILYYQIADINQPADSPDRYYQLTISDEFWLKNARDYGKICIGIDGKYDLNLDRAPVLSVVTENSAGCGLPVAFALFNKENHHTIKLAIDAIKKNIPYDNEFCEHKWYYENLLSGNGFQRVRECQNNNWKPYILIDKHRPSKLAIQNASHKPILCWFHIMKTFSENLNKWQIPAKFRYPIALAFKIVGRSRTEETAIEMAKKYIEFINTLPLEKTKKDKLIDDLSKNWMCTEWKLSFIDAGRISKNITNRFPWTTNNFTERINRTIEAVYSGKQTPLTFVERMYGIKFQSETIVSHEDLNKFESGLVTLFNTQTIEQQTKDDMICCDKLRRLNQGRLDFLLNMVKISSDQNTFLVKKKSDDLFVSSYDDKPLRLDEEIVRKLNDMINFLMKSLLSENVILEQGFHICNVITETQQKGHLEVVNEAKKNLVLYFRNKERVVSASIKNNVIYQGDMEDSYQEIIRLYNMQGNKIFYPLKRSSQEIKDPFRPAELSERTKSNLGAPPKLSAKPRSSHRINLPNQSQSGNTFSIQQRKTKQIQNLKRKREDNLSSISTDRRSTSSFASSSSFIMPSPPRNVFQYLPELPSNDDLNLDLEFDLVPNSHNLCPYCDNILPDILPEKIKDQLQNLQNKPITEEERWSFCIMHHGELNIVPHGLSKGYPEYIDFNVLPSCIIKFEKDLIEIINGNISSYYWDIAFSIYKEVGYNKAKAPMMLMNRFEVFQPGYYGFNGLYTIVNTLIELFVNSNNLTKDKTYPLDPMDFIYEVLVPEVTLRLIQEDRNNSITLEDAKEILNDSIEFGVYMHSNEIDD